MPFFVYLGSGGGAESRLSLADAPHNGIAHLCCLSIEYQCEMMSACDQLLVLEYRIYLLSGFQRESAEGFEERHVARSIHWLLKSIQSIE